MGQTVSFARRPDRPTRPRKACAPGCHGAGATAVSRAVMKSLVVKRSVIIDGHKTSMSLEDAFWQGVKKIAAGRRVTIARLVHEIDRQRQQGNLSSAVRLFVLEYYRSRAHAPRETSEPGLSA